VDRIVVIERTAEAVVASVALMSTVAAAKDG